MSFNPDRLPPHSRDSERALLGSILRDVSVLDASIHLVRKDAFYVFAHQLIFDAACSLRDKGKPVDVVTVAEWLIRATKLEEIGGAGYLAELYDAAPSAANYRQYAEEIRNYSTSRQLIHTCTDLTASAFDPALQSDELLDRAERSILDIAEKAIVGEVDTLQSALAKTYSVMDDRRRSRDEGRETGVPTGFIDLDAMTGGLQNSELVILAARPSVGKTSLALRIALNAASVYNFPVFFVSLEQSAESLMERALCMEGRIDSAKSRKGHLSSDEILKITETGTALESSPFFISDKRGQNMLRIGALARRLHRRHGLRLIVIDYLQLIEPDDRRKAEHEQISGISRRLTHLAGELKIPVLALAQLNRESEAGAGRKPRLSDLRGSGSLEQDGDIVLLMHRPDPSNRAGVIVDVAKNRNGQTGDVPLMFNGAFMRFENAPQQYGSGVPAY